jgi:pimeloyl-ACP methyl ester carboxylesterase
VAWGDPVVTTGHSLGGAMAQLYMASHPNQPNEPGHAAVTFGSPGAVLPPGEDPRISNYVIADDPAVVLGANRADIGELLRADPTLANLAAQRIAEELPGLTREQALASLPNLTVNYDNRGDIVLLPTQDGRLDREGVVAGLAQGDAARHEPELYAATVPTAWTAPGQSSLVVPAAPTPDQELTFLHALYDGDSRDQQATRTVLGDLVRNWVDDATGGLQSDIGDLADQPQNSLGDLARDLQLT